MNRWLLVVLMLWALAASAVVEFHQFDNAEQEQNYQTLIAELRCLVCQNQTIADSNADLAKDLRQQVYQMIRSGQSRQDVVDFMTQRYGDFVLYKPAFNVKTALLWLGPALFVLIGLLSMVVIIRRRKAANQPLSPEQQAHLKALLEEGEQS